MSQTSVTEYLHRAREIASLADRKTGDEKTRLLDIAEAWLRLAEQAFEADRVGSVDRPLNNRKAH